MSTLEADVSSASAQLSAVTRPKSAKSRGVSVALHYDQAKSFSGDPSLFRFHLQ